MTLADALAEVWGELTAKQGADLMAAIDSGDVDGVDDALSHFDAPKAARRALAEAAKANAPIPHGIRYRAIDPQHGNRLRPATAAEAERYEAVNYEHRRRDMTTPAHYRAFYEPVNVGPVLIDEEPIG